MPTYEAMKFESRASASSYWAIDSSKRPLFIKNSGESFPDGAAAGSEKIQLGKRYKSADGAVEVLVNKPGSCDLSTPTCMQNSFTKSWSFIGS